MKSISSDEEEGENEKAVVFRIGSIEVPILYSNLCKYSNFIPIKYRKDEIETLLSQDVERYQQINNIDENNISIFFNFFQDTNIKITITNCVELYKLSNYLQVPLLSKKIRKFIEKNNDDIEIIIQQISTEFLKTEDDNNDRKEFTLLIEKILSNRIDECFQSYLFKKLPISIIYRIVEKSAKKQNINDSLFDFIQQSIEKFFVLLSLIDIQSFSADKLYEFYNFFVEDESKEKYLQYLPINMKYIKKLKEKEDEINKFQQILNEKDTTIQNLKSQLNIEQKEKEDLKSQLCRMQKEIENLKSQLSGIQNENLSHKQSTSRPTSHPSKTGTSGFSFYKSSTTEKTSTATTKALAAPTSTVGTSGFSFSKPPSLANQTGDSKGKFSFNLPQSTNQEEASNNKNQLYRIGHSSSNSKTQDNELYNSSFSEYDEIDFFDEFELEEETDKGNQSQKHEQEKQNKQLQSPHQADQPVPNPALQKMEKPTPQQGLGWNLGGTTITNPQPGLGWNLGGTTVTAPQQGLGWNLGDNTITNPQPELGWNLGDSTITNPQPGIGWNLGGTTVTAPQQGLGWNLGGSTVTAPTSNWGEIPTNNWRCSWGNKPVFSCDNNSQWGSQEDNDNDELGNQATQDSKHKWGQLTTPNAPGGWSNNRISKGWLK